MRIEKATLNSFTAILQRIIDTVLSFIYRTIFIHIMGVTYLGINGLFSNIFSVLSLAELGIGSTIIFLLYEPLNKNDKDEIKSLMKVFSKMYSAVGIIILVIGLVLIPFFPYLINTEGTVIENLNLIYVLILLNSSLSYFFSYKRSLLEADQKGYYSSINLSVFNIISNVFKIVILLISKNYILTLVSTLIITLISNYDISYRANKLYPYLKEKNVIRLSNDKFKIILQRMKAVIIHQISNVVLTGTDNIIISSCLNINLVGIYSNYSLITNTLYGIFTMIFTSITSSVGNMKVTETKEKSEKIFYRLLLANYYFYFVSCVVLYCCMNSFIELWIGNDYILNNSVTIIIILNMYISGMRHVLVTFINASGLNLNTKYKAIVEAILNLIISLVAVKYLGIFGVLLGTCVSLISCSVIVEPVILFKRWFEKSAKEYFLKYIGYFLLTILTSIFLNYLCNLVKIVGIVGFGIKILIAFGFANIIFVLLNIKNNDFWFYINYFKDMFLKIIQKLSCKKTFKKN